MDEVSPRQGRRVYVNTGAATGALVAVVFAAVLSYYPAFLSAIAWCGISGCSGGGFGRTSDPDLEFVLGASGFAGLLWFGAIALPPWLVPWKVRVPLALLVGLLVALVIAWWSTQGFAYAERLHTALES